MLTPSFHLFLDHPRHLTIHLLDLLIEHISLLNYLVNRQQLVVDFVIDFFKDSSCITTRIHKTEVLPLELMEGWGVWRLEGLSESEGKYFRRGREDSVFVRFALE
jgi:hypothetical protein